MSVYSDFIPENTALIGARRIGIYNVEGNRIGQMSLGNLTLPNHRKKIYSFGALSDVHIGERAEAKSDEDFKKALDYFYKNTDFVCVCGDLIHGGTDKANAQIQAYIECTKDYPEDFIYAIAGNHDGAYVSNIETTITTYTNKPLYYTITKGNDVFIFVGNRSTTTGALFTTAELQWLYERLEINRNKRCFLFQHVRPDDGCGNALGIYKTDNWGGTEQTVFESLLRHYKNIVFFHGHSHLKFYMQKFSDIANIDKHFGCWSVHIPSISVPRAPYSSVDTTITTYYAEAEGYVVDVYENGIHLRGRDFVKGEFLPIASYWIDTTLKTIEPNTYIDSTGTIVT